MEKLRTLFIQSFNEFKKLRALIICSLMASMAVILGFITTITIGPFIKLSFSEMPNRVVEFLFGPAAGGFFGGILDILKFAVKPTGPFFPGFTLSAILSGLLYGMVLYKKPIKLYRIAIADMLVKILINCGLNTVWLSILYGKAFMVLLPARITKNIIMWPIDCIIIMIILINTEKVMKTKLQNTYN